MYAAIDIIGAPTAGVADSTRGMMAEVKKLQELHSKYTPSGEYSRIIESICEIVAKRFFTFPSAKRETENGYYDACIKETLASERNRIMDEIDAQDLFGDTLRWLQQRAERLDEIYSQFGEDLKNSIEDLANEGKVTTKNILKNAARHEFLPTDYVNDSRINEVKDGLIRLMLDNEANIDNGRVVPVKDAMEKIYRRLFSGIGAYGPEKMLSVAFSDKKLAENDINVMFGSPTNDRRDEVMNGAEAEVRVGNCLPLSEIPVGTQVHNIELYPGKGGQLVRSAGNSAQLMAKEGKYATLRLPSGEMRMVPLVCRATVGVVGNVDHSLVKIGKAGRKRHMGIRPTVRGSVMNPNDHPHGGGEGKTGIGRPGPSTPWGKPALGLKTRKSKKASNKLIVRRRDGRAIK